MLQWNIVHIQFLTSDTLAKFSECRVADEIQLGISSTSPFPTIAVLLQLTTEVRLTLFKLLDDRTVRGFVLPHAKFVLFTDDGTVVLFSTVTGALFMCKELSFAAA